MLSERRVHKLFQLSVLLKGGHAILECLSGVALALFSTATIISFVNTLTQDELVENPHDFIATHLLAMAHSFSVQTKNFYAFYLLSHGVVKLFLVIGLLRNKLWSYPASLVALAGFVAYQIYRFSYTHGLGLIVLTVFDLFIMVLIWHEYGLVRRHLPLE